MNGGTTVRLTMSHRSLELQPGDDPISTFFFFVFGGIALFVICSMARGQRLAQREAIERQEAERCRQTLEATQAATKLRKRLANAFQVQGLVKVSMIIVVRPSSNPPAAAIRLYLKNCCFGGIAGAEGLGYGNSIRQQ